MRIKTLSRNYEELLRRLEPSYFIILLLHLAMFSLLVTDVEFMVASIVWHSFHEYLFQTRRNHAVMKLIAI